MPKKRNLGSDYVLAVDQVLSSKNETLKMDNFFQKRRSGSDYSDSGDEDSAFTQKLTEDSLSYVDKNKNTITILQMNEDCCRPLKVKCTLLMDGKETCSVIKG